MPSLGGRRVRLWVCHSGPAQAGPGWAREAAVGCIFEDFESAKSPGQTSWTDFRRLLCVLMDVGADLTCRSFEKELGR